MWSYYGKWDFRSAVCPHSFLWAPIGDLWKRCLMLGLLEFLSCHTSKHLAFRDLRIKKMWLFLICFGGYLCPISPCWRVLPFFVVHFTWLPCNLSSSVLRKSDLIYCLVYSCYVRVGLMFSCACVYTKQRWNTPFVLLENTQVEKSWENSKINIHITSPIFSVIIYLTCFI